MPRPRSACTPTSRKRASSPGPTHWPPSAGSRRPGSRKRWATRGPGEALSAAAHAHLLLANHEEAARFAERAFPLLTAAKRPGPAGRALTTLANAHYSLNLPARALSAALGAEALTASAGDLPGRTAALLVLGLAQRDTDRAEDSSASWRTALHIARTLDDPYLTPSTESFLKSVGHLRG